MNKGKLIGYTLLIITALSVCQAYGAYILKNNGDFYIDSSTFYVDSTPIATYITSLAPGGTTTATQASPYSYIISVITGTYYANSTTGGTNYSGADASTVIQDAIDASSTGSTFFFKVGEYDDIDIAVNKNGMRLIGEGRGKSTATYGGVVLNIASGGGIDCSNAADTRWNLYFSDLTISGGNHAATKGIHSDNQMANKKFSDCIIERVSFVGFKAAGSTPIDITNHERVVIRSCAFGSVEDDGVEIMLRSNDYYGGNCRIENNYWTVDTGVTNSTFFAVVASDGKENNNYILSGNALYCRDYPNYFITLNAPSGASMIKIVDVFGNRMEYACLIRCLGSADVRQVNIHENTIDPGTNLDYAVDMSSQAHSWNVHDNWFLITAGRTGIYDASVDTTYVNLIHDNQFTGGGTYYDSTGSPPTVIHDNVGYP